MSDAIVAAIITGFLALLGVVITAIAQNKTLSTKFERQSELADAQLEAKLEKHEAVTNMRIDELTREVRDHNGFARRIPVVEEQIKVIDHRISILERKEAK